jgi:predicted membrane protein
LTSIALFGDVTVDLSETKSTPDEVTLHAWAILRDVEVTVPEGTRVELTGGGLRGHLTSHVAAISDASCTRVVRIDGHTVVGDVTVRQVRSTL